jgi:hypothetical protein
MVYQRSDTARSACTTTLSQHRSAARAIGGFKAAAKLNETGRERFGVGAAHPGRTVWIVDIPADEAAHHRHFNHSSPTRTTPLRQRNFLFRRSEELARMVRTTCVLIRSQEGR